MDFLTPLITFLGNGGSALGAICIALIGVIIWLQKRLDGKDAKIEKKDEEIKLLNQALIVVNEKRLDDATQHITAFIGLGKDLTNANTAMQKSIDSLVRYNELNGK